MNDSLKTVWNGVKRVCLATNGCLAHIHTLLNRAIAA